MFFIGFNLIVSVIKVKFNDVNFSRNEGSKYYI